MKIGKTIFHVIALNMILSGCAGNDEKGSVDENSNEVHVRVWESSGASESFIREAGKRFTEKNPNIIVDYLCVEVHNSIDYMKEFAPKGLAADLFVSPHDTLGAAVEAKLTVPSVNPEKIKDSVLKSCSDALMYKGTMYGYPVSAETYALFYNRKLISDSEVPSTWDELVEKTVQFNERNPGKYGFVMDVTNAYYSILFTTANGNRLFGASGDDKNHPNLNTKEALSGLEFLQSLKDRLSLNNIELSTSSCDAMFASGNAAMHITGLWNIRNFENAGVDFGVAVLPALKGEKVPAASFSGTRGIFVNAYSKHPDEAAMFASFLLTPEMQKLRFDMTGELPSINIDVDSKYMKGFINQLEYSFPMPSIPEMGKFWEEMASSLKEIWNGRDVKESFDICNEKIKGL